MKNLKNAFVILGKITLIILFFFIILIMFLGPILSGNIGSELSAQKFLNQEHIKRITNIVQSLSTMLAVVFVYAMFDKMKDLYLGWKQENRGKLFLEGCLWGIAITSTTFILLWLFRVIRVTDIGLNKGVLTGMLFPIIMFAFVAISEELVSRGYLHGLIKRDFGVAATIIINSFLFALLHINLGVLQSPFLLLFLFLKGVLYAVAREATGGLWVPIGIHFTSNFFSGYIYGMASGKYLSDSIIKIEAGSYIISGGGSGAVGSLITSLIIILFTIAIWKWYGSKNIFKMKKPIKEQEIDIVEGL